MLSVVIADDEAVSRRGMRSLLEQRGQDFAIVGEASDGAEAYEAVERLQPDILITDIRMPKMDGLELIRGISEAFPRVRTVVISGYGHFEYAQQALRAGAMDYLLKPIKIHEFMAILDRAQDLLRRDRDTGGQAGDSACRKVVDEALQYVRRHYSSDISLTAMAVRAHMSPSHFSRVFKAETGAGFQEYVAKVRLDKARECLANTRLKTADIAQMVGYGDPKYFHVIFKRATGMTPVQYRESHPRD